MQGHNQLCVDRMRQMLIVALEIGTLLDQLEQLIELVGCQTYGLAEQAERVIGVVCRDRSTKYLRVRS